MFTNGLPIELIAPAKINLRLKILGQRADGYHLLSMLNATISLADQISLNLTKRSDFKISVSGPRALELSELNSNNLALRAAQAFMRHFNLPYGVELRLNKIIPLGAGLGGGSSDGAAVLGCLAEHFAEQLKQELKLSEQKYLDQVAKIGLTLGSDLPFFLKARLAMVTGIGENVVALSKKLHNLLDDARLTIIYPRVNLSTQKVYQAFREIKMEQGLTDNPEDQYLLSMLKTIEQANTQAEVLSHLEGLFANDLELPACLLSHDLAVILAELRRVFVRNKFQLTGSGSAIFCFASDAPSANEIKSAISGHELDTFDARLKLV